ncbi:MAG: MFS transporter [Pirellulales bacterium]
MTSPDAPPRADERPTRVRYVVVAALAAAAAIAYLARNSIAVAADAFRADVGLSEWQMAWVISAFFAAYALLQVPAGWLGHVWGARRTMTAAMVAASLCTLSFALSGDLAQGVARLWGSAAGEPVLWALAALVISRFGMGAAQAALFPCSTGTIARWFPPTRRAVANGPVLAAMSVGAAIGAALTGRLLGWLDWQTVFVAYAVPGLLWAILVYAWFRDYPAEHRGVNSAERTLIEAGVVPVMARSPDQAIPATEGLPGTPAAREPTPWRALATSPTMWWISGQHFFRAAGYTFFGSWFADYMKKTRGISTAQSGDMTMIAMLAVVAGSLVGGTVSDYVLRRTGSRRLARQGVATASVLACFVLVMAAYFVRDAWWTVALISLGSFCAAISGPCAYTITIDMGGRHVAAVFSVMNMAGSVGSVAFPPVAERIGNLLGWDEVLILFGGLYLAAAICWLSLNSSGTVLDGKQQ